jgi:predicted Holliday junction resolvase-like endonuclease
METSSFTSDVDDFSEIQLEKRKLDILGSKLREDLDILSSYEEDIGSQLSEAKREARLMGRIDAKLKLQKIDPFFSSRKIDPQDVRVLFDPIEYVVFTEMNGAGLEDIQLMSREPRSSSEEKICRSIEETVTRGDIDFQVVTVEEDGKVACDRGGIKPVKPRKRRSVALVA